MRLSIPDKSASKVVEELTELTKIFETTRQLAGDKRNFIAHFPNISILFEDILQREKDLRESRS